MNGVRYFGRISSKHIGGDRVQRLYRSKNDRLIAGVCGGIGQAYNIDPTLLRILFAILLVFTGFFPFGLVYLLMIWIIPKEY